MCSMVCCTCIGVSSPVDRGSVFEPPDCSHRCMYNKPYCIYGCLPKDEPTRFETCRRQQKLNINLENCALRWFVLNSCITCTSNVTVTATGVNLFPLFVYLHMKSNLVEQFKYERKISALARLNTYGSTRPYFCTI